MKVLLITQTEGKAGRPLQAKRVVEAFALRVGREAGSEIHLADSRVAREEGIIFERNGLVFSRGEATRVDITLSSQAVVSERLKPGVPLRIGPYRLTVQEATPEGYTAVLLLELETPLPKSDGTGIHARATQLTIASLGWPKRGAAWALALWVGLVAFLVPAAKPLQLPWLQAAEKVAPGLNTQWWNPGPIMRAHTPIAEKCEACHTEVFTRVQDSACLACHQSIGSHVASVAKGGVQQVGNAPEGRCASCHLDHKGLKPLHKDDDQLCSSCHRNIKAHAPTTTTEAVSDFAHAHPPFRVNLPTARGTVLARVRMGPSTLLREENNIVFPHDIHVDKKGVRSPARGQVVLGCNDCHQRDSARKSFEPVRMERHCQECHQLSFEPALTSREVPHGAISDVAQTVREFYSDLALNGTADSFSKAFGTPGVGLLRRAGRAEADRPVVLALARAKAEKVTQELIEVRTCTTCHMITRNETEVDGERRLDWRMAPIRQHHTWMPKARFSHKAHEVAQCSECHASAQSGKATDVSMPAIESCRTCHGGAQIEMNKLASNCMMCHGFHVEGQGWPSHLPMPTTTASPTLPVSAKTSGKIDGR